MNLIEYTQQSSQKPNEFQKWTQYNTAMTTQPGTYIMQTHFRGKFQKIKSSDQKKKKKYKGRGKKKNEVCMEQMEIALENEHNINQLIIW